MSYTFDTHDTLPSDEELSKLIMQSMPTIRRLAKAAICPGLDFDDAVQEGIIGLCSAVGSYSTQKGASFATYANVCVQNAITSAVRAQKRKKHSALNSAVELTQEAQSFSPEDIAIQNEQYSEILNNIETRLSPLEKRVLSMHLSGNTNAQVSTAIALSAKQVENALSRVRRKLR